MSRPWKETRSCGGKGCYGLAANRRTPALRCCATSRSENGRRLAAAGKSCAMAHISINARGVGPVRLDGDEIKAVMADKPLGDRGAGTIEFRGPVGGFSEEHNARICEAIEEQGELVRSLRCRKRLAMMTENPRDLALDGLATAFERS